MLDDKTYEEWDKASFLAREGDPQALAAFLRAHPELWPETDIQPHQLADLLEGKLHRPRGKPSEATKRLRLKNLVLRAADGDWTALVERLEALHIEHYLDVPDMRVLAEVVRGDYDRSRGPYPGSRIAQALDARDVSRMVGLAQEDLRRKDEPATLADAWRAVGEKVHKSAEWVREEYYKAQSRRPRSPAKRGKST